MQQVDLAGNGRITLPDSDKKQVFLLIDLPVFPKGVISLSLPLLAGYLKNDFEVDVLDLNFVDWKKRDIQKRLKGASFVGMKVSSQSFSYAKELTRQIKHQYPDKPVIWGGELSTLLPDECLKYADCILKKRIEGCLDQFISDLKNSSLSKVYEGGSNFCASPSLPDFSQFHRKGYYNFMGLPLETSAGCNRYCNFCMVHTMQKGIVYKDTLKLETELKNIGSEFLNIIDYNIGMDKDHLLAICATIERSKALGWMGEMCLESLDDDEILEALRKSRCRIIYCGLESIEDDALKSVNKDKTNHPENYKRIIRKAKSYGINIASGFIIGLDGTTLKTFERSLDFFNECGLIYVKITFLTYNPGTYYHTSMKKHGTFLSEEVDKFDGNNLSYLPHDTDKAHLYEGTKYFIRNFYSLSSMLKRTIASEKTLLKRLEFFLFNICYANVYHEWLKTGMLGDHNSEPDKLYSRKFKKPLKVAIADYLIHKVRLMK